MTCDLLILVQDEFSHFVRKRKKMKKIIVLGGSGLVGSRFLQLSPNLEIDSPSSSQVNISNFYTLQDYLNSSNADTVINFAAFTNVDKAEEEKDNEEGLVYKLNVTAAENIAKLCKEVGKHLIHISTDYVFDGTSEVPYKEEDTPGSVNWYGKTKYLGEQKVLEQDSSFCIARIEMPYSAKYEVKKDIVRTFLELLKQGKEINAIFDQKITPTLSDTICFALQKLIEFRSSGIYHLSSTDEITVFVFATLIAEKFNLDKNLVKRVRFSDYNQTRTAKRPQNTFLDTSKFVQEFGSGILKTVSESLDEFKSQVEG